MVGDDLFWFWWNVTGFIATFGLGYLTSLVIDHQVKAVPIDFSVDWSELKSKETVILLVWFIIIVLVSVNLPAILS